MAQLLHGDCVEAMRAMPEASVDAIVTDPPYGLGFMGKEWDSPGALVERRADTSQRWDHVGGNHNPANSKDSARTRRSEGMKFQAWFQDVAAECFRVLKPGGHLLAFGGTRTYHRMACAIEDAGFEIRDSLHWIYGSGFPKSLNVSKAIDEKLGAEREVVGPNPHNRNKGPDPKISEKCVQAGRLSDVTAAASWAARQWEGFGTALKPAHEPVVMARKPLVGTVAGNVLLHGTGGINIDGCRVEGTKRTPGYAEPGTRMETASAWNASSLGLRREVDTTVGRWPPNVLLSPEAADELDRQSGTRRSGTGAVKRATGRGFQGNALGAESRPAGTPMVEYGDVGGASRFYPCFNYVAKPSRKERDQGLAGRNVHPTVKPVALMEWLVRIVTPPGGTVLDPFMGSGTTGIAALRQGFNFIGIEREEEYLAIARQRIGVA